MSDMAFAELAQTVTALPYEEQRELLNLLTVSVRAIERKQRRQLDFNSYVIPCERANFADSYIEGLRSNDRV